MTKNYKLELPVLKDLKEDEFLMYLNLCRQMMYQYDLTTVPCEVVIKQSEVLKEMIDPQIFAKRLGLIKFQNTAKDQVAKITLKNETDVCREIYTDQLAFIGSEGQKVDVISKGLVLMVLRPNTELNLALKFIEGPGISNGKFLSYSGFGYGKNKDHYYIMVGSLTDLEPRIKHLQQQVELLINRPL